MAETPVRRSSAPRYDTYLLTCWQERDEVAGTVTWRFKLETPRSGRWRLFMTLKEVMQTIEVELGNDIVSDS
jgi:hypothetical protein